MNALPSEVLVDEEFEIGRQSSEFFAQLFGGLVQRGNKSATLEDKEEFLDAALSLMDATMAHLDRFIQRANALLSETAKPMVSTNPHLIPKDPATLVDIKSIRRRTVADYIKEKPQNDGKQLNSHDQLLELLGSAMAVRANPVNGLKAKAADLPECSDPDQMSLKLKDRLLKRLLVKSHEARVIQQALKEQLRAAALAKETENRANKAAAGAGTASRKYEEGSDSNSRPPSPTAKFQWVHVSTDDSGSPHERHSISQLFMRRSRNAKNGVAASMRKFALRASSASPDKTTLPLPPTSTTSSLHRRSVRDSTLIHPHPLNPDETVTMPRPIGVAWEVLVDAEGISKKATLPALIRLITSAELIRDPELNHIFFKFFRLFTTPLEVFDQLRDRFRELPPGELTLPQLEVWNQEVSCTRVRVIAALLKWIKEYWQPETDNVILVSLLDFLYTHLKDGTFAPIHAWSIVDALCKCESQGTNYQPHSVRLKIEYAGRMKCTRPWKPSQMLCPPRGASSASIRRSLKGIGGTSEMAIHLTFLASEIYLKINPEEAVLLWRNEKGKTAIGPPNDDRQVSVATHISTLRQFEEKTSLWIQHEVLDMETAAKRAEEISFWLSVAEVSCTVTLLPETH